MLCYKDATFCPFNNCISFNKCERAMNYWWTDEYEIYKLHCAHNKEIVFQVNQALRRQGFTQAGVGEDDNKE